MNEILEKYAVVPAVGFVAWLSSFEWRLRNKIGKDRFNDLKAQMDRTESHLWDLMKAQNITPSIDVPEDIKNNGK